ncbi:MULTISPECIES: hypothetical protein [unclassified Streptomyces]|uniref:hypothetical protein n=1 Tax=unclassified Streptomyces TaxID=2593676 RepID=UPI00209B4FEB|nr:hypothetical protein [Streptomyces sp. YPW6]
MATGTAVAASDGLSSFSESCEDSAVHLSVVASPDIAPPYVPWPSRPAPTR